MLPFGFLDAENGTVTFFNFFLDGITFVFRVYTSNVPVKNVQGSIGTSIAAVVAGGVSM
jgi:hypothetical protein